MPKAKARRSEGYCRNEAAPKEKHKSTGQWLLGVEVVGLRGGVQNILWLSTLLRNIHSIAKYKELSYVTVSPREYLTL